MPGPDSLGHIVLLGRRGIILVDDYDLTRDIAECLDIGGSLFRRPLSLLIADGAKNSRNRR